MTQIKPAVWASSAMVDRAGCGAEGFLYLEGPDVDAEIPLYDQTTVDALRKDAERYRRLVATGKFVPAVSGSGWALGCGSYTKPSKQDLDAAVDAMNGANVPVKPGREATSA